MIDVQERAKGQLDRDMPSRIRVAEIHLDGGTQARISVDDSTIEEYARIVKGGADLDPVELIYDGTNYWPWDGHHRVRAYRMAGRERIPAIVEHGTQQDAAWKCLGANATHGLRRTTEDKANAVKMALGFGKLAGSARR